MKTRRFKKLIGIREWFQIESKRPDSSEPAKQGQGELHREEEAGQQACGNFAICFTYPRFIS